jgi:hypothetical protein
MSGTFRRPELSSGSSAPTTPALLAHLPVWLDGFNINGALNVGIAENDPIATWVNAGVGGGIYNPAEAVLKPTAKLQRINGHPALLFGATSQLVATANPHAVNVARHLFFVAEVPAVVGGGLLLQYNNVGYFVQAGNNSAIMVNSGAGASSKIAAPPPLTNVILEVIFNGVTTDLPQIRINGGNQLVTQNTGVGVGTETQTNKFYVGYHYNAAIGEILDYDVVLTGNDLANTRAYLSNKWRPLA